MLFLKKGFPVLKMFLKYYRLLPPPGDCGNLLSKIRVAAHDAAPPIAPPAIALPTKTAPPTTTGATLEDGDVEYAEKSNGCDIFGSLVYFIE